jgi:hypothetical protein
MPIGEGSYAEEAIPLGEGSYAEEVFPTGEGEYAEEAPGEKVEDLPEVPQGAGFEDEAPPVPASEVQPEPEIPTENAKELFHIQGGGCSLIRGPAEFHLDTDSNQSSKGGL